MMELVDPEAAIHVFGYDSVAVHACPVADCLNIQDANVVRVHVGGSCKHRYRNRHGCGKNPAGVKEVQAAGCSLEHSLVCADRHAKSNLRGVRAVAFYNSYLTSSCNEGFTKLGLTKDRFVCASFPQLL